MQKWPGVAPEMDKAQAEVIFVVVEMVVTAGGKEVVREVAMVAVLVAVLAATSAPHSQSSRCPKHTCPAQRRVRRPRNRHCWLASIHHCRAARKEAGEQVAVA